MNSIIQVETKDALLHAINEEFVEAVEVLLEHEETIHQEFEYISNKLGITKEELQVFFNAPKKTYKDYKSQEFIYDIGAKVLKILGIEKGGKR